MLVLMRPLQDKRKAALGTRDDIAGRWEILRLGIVKSDDDIVEYWKMLCNMIKERSV